MAIGRSCFEKPAKGKVNAMKPTTRSHAMREAAGNGSTAVRNPSDKHRRERVASKRLHSPNTQLVIRHFADELLGKWPVPDAVRDLLTETRKELVTRHAQIDRDILARKQHPLHGLHAELHHIIHFQCLVGEVGLGVTGADE